MEPLRLINNAEGKALPKRESCLSKVRNPKSFIRSNNNNAAAHILEAIEQARSNGVSKDVIEDGVMRVKVVVKKQELKHILEGVMRISNGSKRINDSNKVHPIGIATTVAHSLSAEQNLNLLWTRKFLKSMDLWSKDGGRRGWWRPVLRSIPEEFHA